MGRRLDPAEITGVDKELAEARETIRRLNRRCQSAEAALGEKLQTAEQLAGSRTFGRILANGAATMYREHLEEAQASATQLAEENARLRKSIEKIALDGFGFRRIEVEDGRINISIEDANQIMCDYASAALHLLRESNAPNYVELQMGVPELPGEIVTLTLQRHTGKTPHQLREAAEAERDSAFAELDRIRNSAVVPL